MILVGKGKIGEVVVPLLRVQLRGEADLHLRTQQRSNLLSDQVAALHRGLVVDILLSLYVRPVQELERWGVITAD